MRPNAFRNFSVAPKPLRSARRRGEQGAVAFADGRLEGDIAAEVVHLNRDIALEGTGTAVNVDRIQSYGMQSRRLIAMKRL